MKIIPAGRLPAQHKDNYIAADAFQNFDFRRDKDGKVVVSANATGVYNVSAGAHEYFHALVKEILNTYQISPDTRKGMKNIK